MSHFNCYCKKHKHFGLSHVRFGRRSLVKSVKVVIVISVSLHHQQCYNSAKYNRITLSGLELSSHCGVLLFLFLLGPPVKLCTTPLRAKGTSPLLS